MMVKAKSFKSTAKSFANKFNQFQQLWLGFFAWMQHWWRERKKVQHLIQSKMSLWLFSMKHIEIWIDIERSDIRCSRRSWFYVNSVNNVWLKFQQWCVRVPDRNVENLLHVFQFGKTPSHWLGFLHVYFSCL